MSILSKNPRNIHPAYKEAVVDSLLNGLSARLAGRGDFYKVIYGAKPSAALMSEFIVPMPPEERGGDEEADRSSNCRARIASICAGPRTWSTRRRR